MPQNLTSRNVFINCPFDSEYVDLFRPLVFTLIYLDFEPLFSNVTSSHQVRIHEIMKLNQFNDDLPIRLAGKFTAKEILELQMSDYIGYAQDWVSETRTKIERI